MTIQTEDKFKDLSSNDKFMLTCLMNELKLIHEDMNTLRAMVLKLQKEKFDQFPEWMSRKEVAKMAGVKGVTVDKWARNEKVKRYLKDGKTKYNKDEVLIFRGLKELSD